MSFLMFNLVNIHGIRHSDLIHLFFLIYYMFELFLFYIINASVQSIYQLNEILFYNLFFFTMYVLLCGCCNLYIVYFTAHIYVMPITFFLFIYDLYFKIKNLLIITLKLMLFFLISYKLKYQKLRFFSYTLSFTI